MAAFRTGYLTQNLLWENFMWLSSAGLWQHCSTCLNSRTLGLPCSCTLSAQNPTGTKIEEKYVRLPVPCPLSEGENLCSCSSVYGVFVVVVVRLKLGAVPSPHSGMKMLLNMHEIQWASGAGLRWRWCQQKQRVPRPDSRSTALFSCPLHHGEPKVTLPNIISSQCILICNDLVEK